MTATARLSTHDAAVMLGVTYRQLDYWLRNEVIPETARGSGSRRRYTRGDVAVLAVVAAVSKLRTTTAATAPPARWLRAVAVSAEARQNAGLPLVGVLHVAPDGTVSGRWKAVGFIIEVADPTAV